MGFPLISFALGCSPIMKCRCHIKVRKYIWLYGRCLLGRTPFWWSSQHSFLPRTSWFPHRVLWFFQKSAPWIVALSLWSKSGLQWRSFGWPRQFFQLKDWRLLCIFWWARRWSSSGLRLLAFFPWVSSPSRQSRLCFLLFEREIRKWDKNQGTVQRTKEQCKEPRNSAKEVDFNKTRGTNWNLWISRRVAWWVGCSWWCLFPQSSHFKRRKANRRRGCSCCLWWFRRWLGKTFGSWFKRKTKIKNQFQLHFPAGWKS